MRNNKANAQKILIAGASSDHREIGTSLVADGFQMRFSNTSEAALTALKAWYPDFVIVNETASGFIKAFRGLNFRTPLLARTLTRAGFAASRKCVRSQNCAHVSAQNSNTLAAP
ncbi:MAG: hypothetical protein J0G35_07065 [Acidobacteriales bacterium]|nr:hypothetical protein [Terriglobales bacterium]